METDKDNYVALKDQGKKTKKVSDPLDYGQQHMLKYFSEHPALSTSHIEKTCNLPSGTIRHFLKERRNIPSMHFETVEKELANYGYRPLNDE